LASGLWRREVRRELRLLDAVDELLPPAAEGDELLGDRGVDGDRRLEVSK